MIEIVCEVVVKPEASGLFALAYGPGGAWSDLFTRAAGFRGITVLRDAHDPQHFVIMEVWDSEEQRAQSLAEHEAEYAALQVTLDDWVVSSRELGTFGILSEATVRARPGTSQPATSRGRRARGSRG
jgi:heme-degrading monooxygenase HmoA